MPRLLLSIKVKPSARASALVACPDGTWRASLRSPPVDGKANAELLELVAAHYGCPKSAVSIRSGTGSRIKRVCVEMRD